MNEFEERYAQSKEKFLFGLRPVDVVENVLNYKKSGTAFEIGFGEGRNLFFLAKHGFYCEGIDIAKTGVSKCKNFASQHHLPIRVEQAEILGYCFTKNYDVIISTQVFQFLKKEQISDVLFKMKEHTNKEGLHIITSFTDYYNDLSQGYTSLFKQGELESFYAKDRNWKILDVKYTETPLHTHPG